MLIDADVDAAEQLIYLVSKRSEVGSNIRRVKGKEGIDHSARASGVSGWVG